MGFLSPWFLAGLAALALPVYFHLLRQHKSTPRPFSSLMFFERSTQSSIKHRRLRYRALMALRLALLLLLVLAFASPYLMRTVAALGEGHKLLVLVVDNSFSMREGNRLERAKQGALDALRLLREGDEGQVATLGSRLNFLTLPTPSAGELRAAVQSIGPSDARGSYGELARALRAMGETARAPMEVHLFTDVQRSSLPPAFSDLVLPPSARFVVHPAVDDQTPNFTVESVTAPASVFQPEKTIVQATVAGFGAEPARLTVSLLANGKVLGSQALEVPANGRATAEFRGLEIPYGFNRCEVRVAPADTLPEDDRYLFAVERADPRQILFLQRRARSRARLYFQAAIEASENAAYRVQSMTIAQAASIDPARYAVVVLSDPGTLPGALERGLKQYVRGGGAVLIAAGPATARARTVPVMDVPVLGGAYTARTGERFRNAGYSDTSHPVTAIPEMWDGVKFYQTVRIDPEGTRVLARLADETPLVVERSIGDGRTLLFASTFDNLSNDFPLHPAFVAFVERATHYLGRLEDRTSVRHAGDYIALRAPGGPGQAVEVIAPGGARALSLEESARNPEFQLIETGFYELRRANDRNEMVAVNADRREADLAVIPTETLELWQNTGKTTAAAGSAEAEATRRPWNFWWYVLLLGLIAALAEAVVGTRYLSVDRGAA